MLHPFRRGFTLIELLIVVAIIAILAAIAVPNFLEAQTRSKVSRVQSDIRTAATALESYRVDNSQYPPTPFCVGGDSGVLRVIPTRLSTPIAYITSANLTDPFLGTGLGDFQKLTRAGTVVSYSFDSGVGDPEGNDPRAGRRYYYQSHRDNRRSQGIQDALLLYTVPSLGDWVATSYGPDEKRSIILGSGSPPFVTDSYVPYDPTNGTISEGDIVRSQTLTEGRLTTG